MFSKPNTKNIASAAVTAGAFVAGAKLGDGIAAVIPDSMASYKKFAIAGVSIIAAACITPKTTMAQAGQSALIGMGAKQLYDEFTGALETAVPAKDASTSTNKFVNALVSTSRPAKAPLDAGTGAMNFPWLGEPGDIWERPVEQEQRQLAFTGV
jgi:hypothetical protein